MKVGGNSNALAYFNQYGGVSQYKDAKSKYSSKAATSYREKLLQRAKEDAEKFVSFSFFFLSFSSF